AGKDEGFELGAYSGEWAFWFRKLFGHRAKNKRLPSWAFELSHAQTLALLRGMVASDGYVRGNRYEFITSSDQLAAQVAILMMRVGARPCKTAQSDGTHVVAYSGGDLSQDSLVRAVTIRFPRKLGGRRERVYDLTIEEDCFVVGMSVVHSCCLVGSVKKLVDMDEICHLWR